jgi:hypothetical protein
METLSEQIECEVCEQHRLFKKQLSLALAPRVLILHFKRFDAFRQLKISTDVTFPLRSLDLSPFMRRKRGGGGGHTRSKQDNGHQQTKSALQIDLSLKPIIINDGTNKTVGSPVAHENGTSSSAGLQHAQSGDTSPLDGAIIRLPSHDSAELPPPSFIPMISSPDNAAEKGRHVYDLQGLVCHKGSLTQVLTC